MFGYKYAVLWNFKFLPPAGTVAIEGYNVFSYHYDYESAADTAKQLRDAGYDDAWVEEI